jgi:hypothetical protein
MSAFPGQNKRRSVRIGDHARLLALQCLPGVTQCCLREDSPAIAISSASGHVRLVNSERTAAFGCEEPRLLDVSSRQ